MGSAKDKEKLPVVNIVFTAEEQEVLHGEPAELWKLYLIINRLRDFKTNIAGLKIKISDRTFKEQLEVTKTPGRKEKKLETSFLRRWLKRLEVLGLIEHRGEYVFFLPLAFRPQSVQNRCYQGVTTGVTKTEEIINTLKTKLDNGFEDISINEKNIGVTTGVTEVSHTTEEDPEYINKYIPTYPMLGDLREKISAEFEENKFIEFKNLLAEQKFVNQRFRPEQILHIGTITMIREWISCGCGIDIAKMAIVAVNEKLGQLPGHPTYYLKPVLRAMREIENTKKKSNEISDEEIHARKVSSNHRTSKTQQFYDECFDAIKRARNDD